MVDEGLDLQIGDIRGIWQRRKNVVLGVAISVLCVFILLASLLRSQYRSYAVLLIEPQVIDEIFVQARGFRPDRGGVHNRLHIMTMEILSRPRLSKLIDRFSLYEDEWDEMTREEIIEMMRRDIQLEPIVPEYNKGAFERNPTQVELNTFKLTYLYHSSRASADVVNELSQDFIEEHIKGKVEVAEGTEEFVKSRLESVLRELDDIERRITKIKNENVGGLPEDLDSNRRMLVWTGDDLRRAKQSYQDALQRISLYEQLISGESSGGSTPEKALENLRIELNALRSQGKTDKHPDVRAKVDEIAQLEKQVASSSGGGSKYEGLNTTEKSYRIQRERAEKDAADIQSEIADLEKRMVEIDELVRRTPRIAEELSSLEMTQSTILREYEELESKLAEAEAQTSLESKMKGEHFRVLESAFPSDVPESPNRPLILFLGIFIGLGLGVASGVVLEMLDSSFHDARELQAYLKIPVLGGVPNILLESDLEMLRTKKFRSTVGFSVFCVLFVIGSLAGYVYVNRMDLFLDSNESSMTVESSVIEKVE